MTKREQFIDYVKNGGSRVICSPQIGGGAGFNAKMAGKRFCSEATMQDTIAICSRYKMLSLFNFGLDPFMHCEKLKWEEDYLIKEENRKESASHLDTPYGTMRRHFIEQPILGGFSDTDAVNGVEDLDMLEYAIDTALAEPDFSCYRAFGQNCDQTVKNEGAISVQWSMQPYEMLCYPSTVTTALLPYDDEARFIGLMDKILALDYKILDALSGSGVDFVFLGGPASEMISPAYYEKYLVPYSQKVTDYAHGKGLMIYSHICSPIEPMLSMGYYNHMGIDLFETLSPQPEGNIISLADAFGKLEKGMCTRGNVSLSLMINGTTDDIRREVLGICEAAMEAGRKHIVAASDYLLYNVKEENVAAMADAVEEFYQK